jgi:hypothetical protein
VGDHPIRIARTEMEGVDDRRTVPDPQKLRRYSTYPLVVEFTLRSSENLQFSNLQSSNYDPSKLTTVILTGVTALVRATA